MSRDVLTTEGNTLMVLINGKLLMLGAEYDASTYIHLVEVMYWNRLMAQGKSAAYPEMNRIEWGILGS